MLRDFSKMMTFLTVVREASFSKASGKLGISQPAVTQQIKHLEDTLQARLLERRKNGITLTKEGEEFYRVVQRLEKCLHATEKEMMRIVNKELSFTISASFVIGNYVLPEHLSGLKATLNGEVFVNIKKSAQCVDDLFNERADLVLVESPVFRDGVIFREWLEDELVFFSNKPLPKHLTPEDLKRYAWICREEGSHTRRIMMEVFGAMDLACRDDFETKSTLSDSTAVKQAILKYPKDDERQIVGVMSRVMIGDEVKAGTLHEARLKGRKITRRFYIGYLRQGRHHPVIENAVKYLQSL